MSKRHEFTEEELDPYLTGKIAWPNFKAIELGAGLDMIACGAGYGVTGVKRILLQGKLHSRWARYFLNYTQSGGQTGEALVVVYGGGEEAIVALVSICQHEKRLAPGANPMRGWHPGHCVKCGLDMTVDSGD